MTDPVQVIGDRQVAVLLGQDLPRKTGIAARQTLNTGARRGRTRLVQIVRQQVNLPAVYVRELVNVRTASTELRAEVTARKRDVQLARFGARQNYAYSIKTRKRIRAGVTVQVKAGGNREQLPGAFLVKLKNGATGLAIREKGKGRYTTGNARFEVLYGPSVQQITKTYRPQVVDELQQFVSTELQRRIALLVAPAGQAAAPGASA